jgi:hypothetical protein
MVAISRGTAILSQLRPVAEVASCAACPHQSINLATLLGNSALPARRWMDQQFPHVDEFATKARRHLHGIEPWSAIEGRVPPVIGTAMDYRIRYAFGITPVDEFIAFQGATLAVHDKLRLMPVYNLDLGRWLTEEEHLGSDGSPTDPMSATPQSPILLWLTESGLEDHGPNLVNEFFAQLHRRVPELAPVNRRLLPDEEDELDRFCLLLALFEQVARTGMVWPGTILAECTRETTCASVLESFPQSWLDDMAGLSAMFYKPWAYYLGRPATLNPHFRGGGDGDLIVDGILFELKTYQRLLFPATIRQLLAYVLLDTEDGYGIYGMGIYMVRHGRLIVWRLEEALDSIAGPGRASLAELRAGFRNHLVGLDGNACRVGADGLARPSIRFGSSS